MKKTDTEALAKAIAEFEAEFPDLIWSISKGIEHVAIVRFDANGTAKTIASSYHSRSFVNSFQDCIGQLRKADADALALEGMMDAEYGCAREVA